MGAVGSARRCVDGGDGCWPSRPRRHDPGVARLRGGRRAPDGPARTTCVERRANEARGFTDQPYAESGLLGMDLLRLALERASSADEAVGVIVDAWRTERHGPRARACTPQRPGFTYHNVVPGWRIRPARSCSRPPDVGDRAGRRPGTEHQQRVDDPGVRRHPRRPARARAATSAGGCGAAPRARPMRRRPAAGRRRALWSRVNARSREPAAHAGGRVTSTQTTSSWVADLRGRPRHWATATSAPCTSLFKPTASTSPSACRPTSRNRYDETSLWWRHERLHRLTLRDHLGLLARYRHARDRTEATWLTDPPPADPTCSRRPTRSSRLGSPTSPAGVPDRAVARWLTTPVPPTCGDRGGRRATGHDATASRLTGPLSSLEALSHGGPNPRSSSTPACTTTSGTVRRGCGTRSWAPRPPA